MREESPSRRAGSRRPGAATMALAADAAVVAGSSSLVEWRSSSNIEDDEVTEGKGTTAAEEEVTGTGVSAAVVVAVMRVLEWTALNGCTGSSKVPSFSEHTNECPLNDLVYAH